MPGTKVHMIWSFTFASTLARLMGFSPIWILCSATMAAALDALIDLGHEGYERSAATHSLAAAPIPLILALIIAKLSPGGVACLEELGAILTVSMLGHLFWDSLTVDGVHVPFAGWVRLASLRSRGAVANALPIVSAAILTLAFWHPSGISGLGI